MKKHRITLIFIIIFFCFSLLFVRSFYLQIIKWKDFRIEVQDLSTRIIKQKAKRGNIYDRNGKLLAWNERIYKITNLSDEINTDTEKRIRTILSKFNIDTDSIIDKLNFQKKINLNINSTTAKKLSSIRTLLIEEKYIRKYAHNSLYHITGYVDNEGTPRSGLELTLNDKLKGEDGYKIVNITPSGRIKNIIEKTIPIPGNDIYLTIDLDIQEKIYTYLSENNKPGAVVVSNPNNGEIIAMVSYPSPDPNDFSKGLTNLKFQRILNDNKKPMYNRAIYQNYPPGSVIKPFLALSALELGISPEATINSTGKYQLKNSRGYVIGTFKDWWPLGHGITDMIKAIRVSANSYFYWLGETIGIDAINKKVKEYKLTEKTDIDLPGEKSGFFPSREWKEQVFKEPWYPGNTLNVFIGQGNVKATPLEILRFYNILATQGKYYQFHLFNNQKDLFNKIEEQYIPQIRDNYNINEEYLKYILKGMKEVTTYMGNYEGDSANEGTAYEGFKGFPYVIAGKTGTAEVSGGKKPHAWFAGFFPADTPKYSIVVFLENAGYGPHIAVPLARKSLDFIINKIIE